MAEPRGALVTGGGRGIGAAVARALAADGCPVVVAARSANEIEAVATAIREGGGRAWAVTADVTDVASVERMAEAAAHHLGRIDILVNNAGVSSAAPLARVELSEWNRLLTVNATGPFLCTRAVVPGMVERGWGRVVTVASIAGLHGAKYITAYAASKHAVIGFVRSVAAEVAGTGVTANAVCPGYVDTPMTDGSLARIAEKTGRSNDDALAAVLAASGQPRLITPEEVAFAVRTLCAEEAGGINGETVVLGGGGVLR